MTAEAIASHLTTRVIGRPLRVYQEVTSTNDVAMELANGGAPEGFTIFAESQTNGRGRLGRTWNSLSGDSLAFSILLRPTWKDSSRLSLVAAVAVARAVERLTTEPVGIKWPNDIYVSGKKIAGILCESSQGAIVIGIGVNVSQQTCDFPVELTSRAGSVAMFSKQNVSRIALAADLLNELDNFYAFLPESFPSIISECADRSILLGREIVAEIGSSILSGRVIGLDSHGALQICNYLGEQETITAGEVTLLKV